MAEDPHTVENKIDELLRERPDEMIERPTEQSELQVRKALGKLEELHLLDEVKEVCWTLVGCGWIVFKNNLNMFQEYQDSSSWFLVERHLKIRFHDPYDLLILREILRSSSK